MVVNNISGCVPGNMAPPACIIYLRYQKKYAIIRKITIRRAADIVTITNGCMEIFDLNALLFRCFEALSYFIGLIMIQRLSSDLPNPIHYINQL
jgi:hypothetical protein